MNTVKFIAKEQLKDFQFIKNNFTIQEIKIAAAKYVTEYNDIDFARKIFQIDFNDIDFAKFKKYIRNNLY